jgi:hypothetical protein
MSVTCPSDFGLESYLLERGASAVGEHVAACRGCAQRVALMEKQGQDFRAFVFPATIDTILDSVEPRRAWWRNWRWAGAPALLAAAAALLLVVRVGPESSKFALRVYGSETPGAALLGDGARIPVGASLGFQVVPPDSCYLWLVSVDESGAVSRLLPTQGDQGMFVDCDEEQPGAAVMGGKPGLERVFAVCGGADLSWSTVAESVRRTLPPGASALRSTRKLQGLPDGTAQKTLLLEKVP